MSAQGEITWQQANDAYLAAAVEWLRLLLGRHAGAPPVPTLIAEEPRAVPRAEGAPQQPNAAPWWSFRRGGSGTTAAPLPETKPPLALPPASFEVTQEQVDEAAQRMRAAEAIDPPPALTLLARRLGLTPFERNVLLLCVAMELDTRIGALCARVHNDQLLPFPTFALAFTIFQDGPPDERPHWDARSPERPLLYWRLIETNASRDVPFTTGALRADERIVNFVKGLSHLDERVAPFVAPLDRGDDENLPPSHRELVEAVLQPLTGDSPHFGPIQLLGSDSDSKQSVARAAASRLGITLYHLSADLLPMQAAELETLCRVWRRETFLLPVGLYLDAYDLDRHSEMHGAALKRFLAGAGGVLFVDARETWPVPRGGVTLDVSKPDPAEQRALWQEALGGEHAPAAADLAAQFNLSAAAIAGIAAETKSTGSEAPLIERVWKRAAERTRMHIDALAQRIEAKATWDDLVLPDAELDLLHQIVAHVTGRATVYDDWGFRERMNRGFGISALFAGESGTGKTMAAEVIANELGVSVHRIDLSAVVSKWVGETQKHLQLLFNAADDSNGILFFDEADALFGKRSEVQHSQDRWANMEINFLLQRLESYRGLAILATNMKSALDAAFLRRLRFIVNFSFPGPAERKRIWMHAFPGKLDTSALDFDRLAKLSITGASVHNIALAAAFLAAQRKASLSMPIVLEAARTEMKKLEKPVNELDFQWSEERRGARVLEMKR
ncbi:MAG TPA: AAA family ATPase [Thermoanaerobaculia bacterium]|nr:AAA family ATPase [Thermoanaerobaculia bacterium]